MTLPSLPLCLCSHDPHSGQCPVRICGCTVYRPASVAAEVESFLAARFPDKGSATDGEVA